MPDLVSRPYNPDPAKCCERCVFGTGPHSEWCPARPRPLPNEYPDLPLTEAQLDKWAEQWVEP